MILLLLQECITVTENRWVRQWEIRLFGYFFHRAEEQSCLKTEIGSRCYTRPKASWTTLNDIIINHPLSRELFINFQRHFQDYNDYGHEFSTKGSWLSLIRVYSSYMIKICNNNGVLCLITWSMHPFIEKSELSQGNESTVEFWDLALWFLC